MIIERKGYRNVLIRHRDASGKRVEQTLSEYHPYGFLLDVDASVISALSKEPGYTGVYGESLTKVILSDPAEVGNLKNQFDQTWECNIPWTNRCLSEHIKDNPPIENYDHRIWYLDMEWTTDSEKITIISVFDSFKKTMWTWAVAPENAKTEVIGQLKFKNHPYGQKVKNLETKIQLFSSEREMLNHFIAHMRICDPDIITGWNVVNADCRVLIERCQRNGIDPKTMCGGSSRTIRYDYKDWSQPIGGRMVIDLMLAVTKLWQIKNGALPNKKLDTVANLLLKEEKLPLADGHDTYYTDFHTYIDYNIQDVELLPKLDKMLNAINHHLAIQHIVQCDIQTTPFVTRLFTCLTINDPDFTHRIPSRAQFDFKPYQGADIMEPTPGVYNEGIAIMDIKAMYHSNAALHNISWETLEETGVDCGNGTCFHHDTRGHLVRQMDRMTDLRNKYKALMKSATDDDERAMYDAMQYATKSLVASMYGAAGDSKYGLYHPDVAAAITFTSRQTLFRLREECEKYDMKVIYGHTDSVFVLCDSPDIGMKNISQINANMSPIETEFEKWCSSMLIMAKNRYAGMTAWTDGESHEPKLYVKGIELKQNRLPPLMKEVMHTVIHGLLDSTPEDEITGNLVGLLDSVISKKVDVRQLCISARLQQNLEQYKVLGESRAGAAWANRVLGKGYRKGDSFLSTLSADGSYIAFDDPTEIQGICEIGYRHLAERFVIAKVRPYYESVGFDMQPLLNSLNGVSGVDWL